MPRRRNTPIAKAKWSEFAKKSHMRSETRAFPTSKNHNRDIYSSQIAPQNRKFGDFGLNYRHPSLANGLKLAVDAEGIGNFSELIAHGVAQ